MNLIILTESDEIDEGVYRLSDHRAEHMRSVLKVKIGDRIEVGLLNGPQGKARVESVTGDAVELMCDQLEEFPAPRPSINLICALPRPQTLKKILITSAMMGVRSLQLIRANRVEKSYFQSPLMSGENQLPYLVEGLAQGKLTRLPEVSFYDRFRRFFEDGHVPADQGADQPTRRLLCTTDAAPSLDTVFEPAATELTIAIGPEGGWVPFEIELMQSVGFKPFSLGRWVLRVEHAVTAALSQIELLRMIHK